MKRIAGKVWRFGDHVDTDQIIPAERLVSENLNNLNDFIFEKVRPGMASVMSAGDIIVAGKNFGCGSSREHAPRSLIQAGVSCVVAESFARIFFRNSINTGLLLVECRTDIKEGDIITVDPDSGKITDAENGMEYAFPQYPEFIGSLISKGGLMAKIKEDLR
ncbi:MAG: 3-isopropylmalate dehydratase [Methanomassiliicoccaceae archaeon]|jgi:3-isopropylmalate dehydratase small subunit|nr:3-isopropylmalate dehydratase [Methanomassiliicoccaceae archaeon]